MVTQNSKKQSNTSLTLSLVAIVLGMTMLTASAVPLYNMFCRITGYGGTTQVAEIAPDAVTSRKMEVRFNTDVQKDMPWHFRADQGTVTVNIGEERLISFSARNDGDVPVWGTAIYNVTPHSAAEYFSKIQCFCFDSQRLDPGQEMHMPVSFFIDPQIMDDPYLQDLETVTLSYTFFLSKNQSDETSGSLGQPSEKADS
ncbi:MAG: cytochrome c oxidase assembly protein [Alphaproteobacteria bacterium]|nr:cytochrome c oxidase assembly protein [Alphaproteobacteria bacterium]